MLPLLYKQRRNKWIGGVLAGIANKFGWQLPLLRAVVVVAAFLSKWVLAAYVVLAICLPYKEDHEAERYGTGPRKCKDAEKIDRDGLF